jgi:hypothetical protein
LVAVGLIKWQKAQEFFIWLPFDEHLGTPIIAR